MTQKTDFGRWGEDRACEYLVENGYKVIDRNFRKSWGELDIVAKYKDGTLVFVEVKTVHNPDSRGVTAEDQMTAAKVRKFKKAASLYAGHRPELIDDELGWRLDLLTLTKLGKDFLINHYQNII